MNIKPQTIECVGGMTLSFCNDEYGTVAGVKVSVGARSWLLAFGANGEVKRITHTREYQLTDDDPRRSD